MKDLTAGNKKGVNLIINAAVWADLFPQFCTNCSESIWLDNPNERFSVSFLTLWAPCRHEREMRHLLSVLCFPEKHSVSHRLERERGGKAGRRSKTNIEDISSFEAAYFLLNSTGYHLIIAPLPFVPRWGRGVSLRDSGTTATSSHRPRLPLLTTLMKSRRIDRLLMENKLLWISLSGEITQHRELSHNYVQWVSRKWTPWDVMCESAPAPITFQESAKQHQKFSCLSNENKV